MKNQIIITCLLLTLFACNSKNNLSNNELSILKQTINYPDAIYSNTNHYITSKLPVPFEMFKSFKTQNNNQKIKLSQINFYAKDKKTKAFLLGCLSIDLNYCIAQKNKQLATKYLQAIKKLANELQLEDVISIKIYKRLNENLENPDSLERIAQEINNKIFQYFSNSGKINIFPFTILGGWFETFNIISQLYNSDYNKLANTIIPEQPQIVNLRNFIYDQLLSTNADYYYPDISKLTKELQDLTQLIEKLKIAQNSIERNKTLYTFINKSNFYRNNFLNGKL